MPVALRVLTDAKPFLAPLAATKDKDAKAVLDAALREAASVDGDRCVDAFEAEAVRQAFDAVKPQGGALTLPEAQQLKSALDVRLGQLREARPKTTDVVFTSTGNATQVFRDKILGGVDEVLARANGKPADLNVLLFAFTDKVLADGLADRCRNNPNLTVRVLTDWSDLASSGGRQAPRLAKMNLPNLLVKFKADNPYSWSASRAGPVYNHGATEGLNHHKGFVALVDGRPEKMALGSFNWSEQAMEKNLENLMALDRGDVDNRAPMEAYEKEFEGFWNDDKAALSYAEALRAREDAYAALAAANHGSYVRRPVTAADIADPVYAPADNTDFVDVNSFRDADADRLQSILGKGVAEKVWRELAYNGRFDTLDELKERVPEVASLSAEKLQALADKAELGDGSLSINTANVEELDRAGFSRRQAEKLVAYRDKYGALENLDEAHFASGIGKSRLEKIGISLSDDEARGFFSARRPGGSATTGWDAGNRASVNVPKDPAQQTVDPNAPLNRSELEAMDPTLAAPVTDMLRRAPAGETFRFAMYGVSDSSPEFKEMEAAAKRGVKIRAVLYNAYNKPAIDALKALKAQGCDVELKIISSRVMHEKFGVCGDDVWNGSANMSLSSITKHTEDRFYFRNMPNLAQKFVEEFDRLWALGH